MEKGEEKEKKVLDRQDVKLLTLEERRAQVSSMRIAGMSLQQIADFFHVTPATISLDMDHILGDMQRRQQLTMGEWRSLELERLDTAQRAIWQAVLKGSYPALQALDRIMTQRAKLLGLYAPMRVEVGYVVQIVQLLEMSGANVQDFFKTLLTDLRQNLAVNINNNPPLPSRSLDRNKYEKDLAYKEQEVGFVQEDIAPEAFVDEFTQPTVTSDSD